MRILILLSVLGSSILCAAQNAPQPFQTADPASSSVLANGQWFKMKIYQTGIYRLTYEDIAAMGFSEPSKVKIFGNGGSMLPLMNSNPAPDDLVENKVFMNSGSDGIFNQGDYILFYGRGPITWSYNTVSGMFEHQIHLYSNASYYFVTTGTAGKERITTRVAIAGEPTIEINTFDDYNHHERNKYNFLESGRQWFGGRIDDSPFDSTFMFNGLASAAPLKIKANVASRSSSTKYFTITCNDAVAGVISTTAVILRNKTGAFASQKSDIFEVPVTKDQINLKISYNQSSSEDEAYIDYIILNARRMLSLTGDMMQFRDASVTGENAVARYTVSNCDAQTEIWDVTDPANISRVPTQLNGSQLSFTDSINQLREYIVLKTASAFPKPVINADLADVGIIPNQNLHAEEPVQMLIVTNPLFIQAADSIAEFHRIADGMSVLVANTEQIYNEFSSGAPDVSAIRNFARLLYKKSSSGNNKLKYLLLVGDGSYNNLLTSDGNSNFIITYQSENSINASYSYVSDDFYGLMDDTEGGSGNMEDFSLDLGIGRLPVKTAEEAMNLYRKIRNYNSPDNKGDWQNNILFAADDEDGNLHMDQANDLANWVDVNYPEYAVKKVFIDAYEQVASSSGTRYPDANKAITGNIEKGLLIFNYTGHGGELGLADEQILMREDLEKLTNADRLPLFITATCEFSRFDDLIRDEEGTLTESTSAGEFSILNPDGGCIALITTTRIVYSSENQQLNSRFYEIAFERDGDGNYYRFGDMMRMTKNALVDSRNKLNFILLGDPALRLAIPIQNVITDSINHISVSESTDTLKAFSRVVISGHIEDEYGNPLENYNGIIYPSVFDKKKTITTLANDVYAQAMHFTTREDLLYKGKASVANGMFRFEFVVPKDITYNFGNGKIVYYAKSDLYDAHGEFSDFVIGGTDVLANQDSEGPEISLFLNDELFNNKGITNPNPVIYAKIRDESGINTIGNGIGHDITGVIDGNISHPVLMNEFFESELDDYTSGKISYPMENLSAGMHSLQVKVWDIYNNSSTVTIEFRVIDGNLMAISKAGNFPNPARDHTTFHFEHNKPDEELTVTITVYDIGGRLIHHYTENMSPSGFNSYTPVWDLKDLSGNMLKQGIYPYRIRISNEQGIYADSFQKLVVIR